MAALIAGPLLTKVFEHGVEEVGKMIQDFDFSQLQTSDVTADNSLKCQLAPSFGTLNKDTIKLMDEKLQVMIAGTMKSLEKLSDKSWEKIVATMKQNEVLVADETEVFNSNKLIKESSSDFDFNGNYDAAIVNEVKSWFVSLIADDDILKATSIDIKVMADIVATTGTIVESLAGLFAHQYKEKTMIDIGVLRFPDIENPYFKLYRIKLVAWSDSSRLLFHTSDKNGITGEFNSKIFRPRESVISGMRKDLVAKAVASVEDLFA